MSDKRVVSNRDELALRRQWDEVLQQVLRDSGMFAQLRYCVQQVGEGHNIVDPAQLGQAKQKHNRAQERQQAMETFYRDLGFDELEIPVPTMDGKPISNREFGRRAKANQALFYRPATSDVSYEAFMQAVGQDEHWTVADEDERAKIAWEPTEEGYWFWAEVQDSCPRTGTCWNDLTAEHTLLCIEEYVIVWHAMRVLEDTLIDRSTWSWLRTRYQTDSGSGALYVFEYDGGVDVYRSRPEHLSIDYDYVGGRVSEVVNL